MDFVIKVMPKGEIELPEVNFFNADAKRLTAGYRQGRIDTERSG